MKKITSVILIIICMACLLTGCKQPVDNQSGSENVGKVCKQHTGNVTCETCGVNYYDELKALIIIFLSVKNWCMILMCHHI